VIPSRTLLFLRGYGINTFKYRQSAGDMSDNKEKPQKDPFLDSSELFESLFREAPLEEDKKTKPAPEAKKPIRPTQRIPIQREAQAQQAARPKKEGPPGRQIPKPPVNAAPPEGRAYPEKKGQGRKADPPPRTPGPIERFGDRGSLDARTGDTKKPRIPIKSRRPRPRSQEKKRPRVLKAVVFLVLLGAGAAAAASYLGFVDLGRYRDRLMRSEPHPVLPQVARTTPQKESAQQIPSKPSVEKPKAQPIPAKPATPTKEAKPQVPVSREPPSPPVDKPARTETPVSPPASPPSYGAMETQAQPSIIRPESTISPPTPPVIPPKPAQEPPKLPPAQKDLTQATAPLHKQPPLLEQPARYPFSVYLGAFMTLDRARVAVSIYEKNHGISSHWVKVDLGEKGVWYRIFTGHFRTEQEAEAFIKQKQLQEGEVKQTRYSTLIGEYGGKVEAEEMVRKLLQLGYASYRVPSPGGRIKLVSGAFYTQEGAKRQQAELLSKGIKNQVVER
jgi:hypothetical protein